MYELNSIKNTIKLLWGPKITIEIADSGVKITRVACSLGRGVGGGGMLQKNFADI